MSLISVNFIIFMIIGLIIYYSIPKRFQWIILLLLSSYFYASAGWKTCIYMIVTIVTIWSGAILIEKIDLKTKEYFSSLTIKPTIEEKKKIKKKAKRKKQICFWSILALNIGILAFLKYINFMIENVNYLLETFKIGQIPPLSGLILPLGISFYTFQSIGYLTDVYWGKIKAEKNIFKFSLFISFFPQIIQGPIDRYDQLAKQLYAQHKIDIYAMEKAAMLMLWGYFKKMVISNRAIFIVDAVFGQPESYGGGLTILGVLMYSIQQYADFSGGIDIISGAAGLFGITMAQNFKRPYFSESLSEFWRRWHISLGAWMRDYVFYPFALTKSMTKLGRMLKDKVGENAGKVAPVAIGNILVFLIVGIWHGPYWHYVIWGLYNGVIIAFSALMEPVWCRMKGTLHISGSEKWFKIFKIVRTFLIVNFGWFFDRCAEMSESVVMIQNTFTKFSLGEINVNALLAFGLTKHDYIILIFSVIILFMVSVIQESTGKSVRNMIWNSPLLVRWMILLTFIFFTIAFTKNVDDSIGGFMYAQF